MNSKKIILSFLFVVSSLTYSQDKNYFFTGYTGNEEIIYGRIFGLDCRKYLKGGFYGLLKLHRSSLHERDSSKSCLEGGKSIDYLMDERRKVRHISAGFGYDYSFKEKHSVFFQATSGVSNIKMDLYNVNDGVTVSDGVVLERKWDKSDNETGRSETITLGYDYNIYSDFFIGGSAFAFNQFGETDMRVLFNFRLSYLIR